MFVIFETFALPEGKSLSDLEKKRDEIVRACVIKLSEWKKKMWWHLEDEKEKCRRV